ncbi:hypothetical protein Tco_1150603, partial [Tanacetum coccineum]
MMDDLETKMEVEIPYELLKDDQKNQLGKNNEAKMTLYNALPRNSQVKDFKVDLLIKQYEKFSISNEETINSGFTRFNVIVTSLKSLDQDYSSKNHVRKFLRALLLKWRSTMMAVEEAKTTKEKVKSLASKAKVTREQTSDDSNSQGGSDEDIDEEEEAEAFNLFARNFCKGHGNSFEDKGGESSKKKG